MTADETQSPSSKRPIILPPLLVALAALLVYGITVNHWVTLRSLTVVAKITGWDWHALPLSWRPENVAPLYLLLTCPIRILPAAWQPLVLNLFSVVCASVTLGLLAASIRLLPHDRTREQRQREGGEYSLLSIRAAFLPSLFAVLILGLQMNFWRDAVAASNDILNVMVFAFLIYCVLKFRINQNDEWLAIFAFVYGLGMTNDWALMGYLPFFLIALLWIKGASFFSGQFLGRIFGCGAMGLLLYLLVPTIGSLGADRANFLTLLHAELGAQKFGLLYSTPRLVAVAAALPSLLPLGFLSVKWPSFEGELNAAGNMLTKSMFRLLHIFLLLLALVMFFDFRYSPSVRMQEAPIGFLTLYYVGALCIGYFSGYVLLVYGKEAAGGWERRSPLLRIFNYTMVGALCALAVAAPICLFLQNDPHIAAGKSGALAEYARETIAQLPAKSSIVLCDDPLRLYLIEAAYAREGKQDSNILIDTASLSHREYLVYLIDHYAELKKITSAPGALESVYGPDKLINYLLILSTHFPLYYMHPSFGYYFEVFYLEPRGLVYQLRTFPTNSTSYQAPLSSDATIKLNQDIWNRLAEKSLKSLPATAKLDPDASVVSVNYSVALNLWGVDLQRMGTSHLAEANERFAQAIKMNPQNFLARINKQYNEQLQKGDHKPINSEDYIYKAVNLYRGAVPILKYNGPADEPDVDLTFGRLLAGGHNLHQAAGLFERRLQLLPGDLQAEMALAMTFVDMGAGDKALELARKLHPDSPAQKWEVARIEALAYYVKNDYASAETLMQAALKENPHDDKRLAVLADFYRVTAHDASLRDMASSTNLAVRKKAKDESDRRFKNALEYITQQSQILQATGRSADDPYGLSDLLLRKAEVEMMLSSFQSAVATLTQLLQNQPANATALLNRAIAEMKLKQFQAAKDDYKALRKYLPQQPYAVDYGLADIASQEKDKPEEIRRLRRYLDAAPANTTDYALAKKRLRQLESQ